MNLIDSVGACCRLVFWDVDRESNAVWRWYNVRKQVRKIVQTREIYPEEGLFSYLTDFLGNPLILIMLWTLTLIGQPPVYQSARNA